MRENESFYGEKMNVFTKKCEIIHKFSQKLVQFSHLML